MKKNLKSIVVAVAGITGIAVTVMASSGNLTGSASRAKEVHSSPGVVVLADDEGGESETSKPVYNVPVTFAPTQEQVKNEMVIVNVNGDSQYGSETTWSYSAWSECLKYSASSKNAADDWVIFPGVQMSAGKYKISISCKVGWENYAESLKIYLGSTQSVEGMTQEVLDLPGLTNEDYEVRSQEIEVDGAGVYYVGVYCNSPVATSSVSIKDVKIEKIDLSAPKTPEIKGIDLDGLEGSLKVTIPSKNMGDEDLTDEVGLELTLDDSILEIGQNKFAAGSEQSIELKNLENGKHSVKARVWIEKDGENLYSDYSEVFEFTATKKQPESFMGYTFGPDEDEASWCTIIDSNADNTKWEYFAKSTSPYADDIQKFDAFRYNGQYYNNDADDWLILPAFNGEAGVYELTFDMGAGSQKINFDVCYGSSAEPEELQKNILLSKTDFNTVEGYYPQYQNFSVKFNHEGTENFYIAFHTKFTGYSKIYLKEIMVAECSVIDPKAASMNIDFNGKDGKVEVTLPTEDIAGNQLSGTVNADLYIDGELNKELSGEPGQKIEVPLTLEYGNHTALLKTHVDTTYAEDVIESFRVFVSPDTFLTVPATFALNAEDFNEYMLTDANNDEYTWAADEEKNAVVYKSHRNYPGNDWLFMTKVDFASASQVYSLSIDYSGAYKSYKEQFEIWIGNAANPEAMTKKIADVEEITNTDFETLVANFMVDEPGKYVIGIKATSEDAYSLYVKNLKIETAEDTPLIPEVEVAENEDNKSLTLSWEAITTGECGTTLSDVKYRISEYDAETGEWTKLEDVVEPEYIYTNEETQKLATLGVEAFTLKDEVETVSRKMIVNRLVGALISEPLTETFAGGEMVVNPVILNDGPLLESNVDWNIKATNPQTNLYEEEESDEEVAESVYILEGKAKEANAIGTITLPRMEVADAISGEFNINLESSSYAATFKIIAINSNEEKELGEVDMTDKTGYTDCNFEIPAELFESDWLQIRIQAEFPSGSRSIARIGGYSLTIEYKQEEVKPEVAYTLEPEIAKSEDHKTFTLTFPGGTTMKENVKANLVSEDGEYNEEATIVPNEDGTFTASFEKALSKVGKYTFKIPQGAFGDTDYMADNTTGNASKEINKEYNIDVLTGIADILSDKDVRVFNLNGVKIADSIESLKPGIYIINGKKIMIK